jgi:N6-adenosine-specific RNA methylase IME4
MNKKYKTILADPPWYLGKMGKGKDSRPGRVYQVGKAIELPYDTMSVDDIMKLNIEELCDKDCHLWLWTTNRNLHDAFHVMDAWGFKYHNIITWYKPAGLGAWFINKTQHLLFGYKGTLKMGKGRYTPTIQKFLPKKHSKKPEYAYEIVESISEHPYLEMFAREHRIGWDVYGNEVEGSIEL